MEAEDRLYKVGAILNETVSWNRRLSSIICIDFIGNVAY
jgi:hypothetical protein